MSRIYWIARYDYVKQHDDEVSLKRCDIVELLSTDPAISGDPGWWTGLVDGKVGAFPSNYVAPITSTIEESPSNACLIAESHMFPPIVSSVKIVMHNLIGSGGFGRVYRATYAGQEVAIKILGTPGNVVVRSNSVLSHDQHLEQQQQPSSFSSPSYASMLSKLFREGFLFNQLDHENIIRLIGICIDMPVFGLVMELAEGGALSATLHASVDNQLPIRYDILLSWLRQIASGMHYLHDLAFHTSVLHRDLKSSNVLILENVHARALRHAHSLTKPDAHLVGTTLKIVDFGLAKKTANKTEEVIKATPTTIMAGTYAWMAPEVIRSASYSTGSDVWSFSVVAWELLTREIPYKNFENFAVAYGVAVNKLRLHVPSSCPSSWADLLADCWHLDPAARPSFSQIVERTANMSTTNQAIGKSHVEFSRLQASWRSEIEDVMAVQKTLEDQQEVELKTQIPAQDVAQGQELKVREAELDIRERDLAQREIDFMLLYQRKQQYLSSLCPDKRVLLATQAQMSKEVMKRCRAWKFFKLFHRSNYSTHSSSDSGHSRSSCSTSDNDDDDDVIGNDFKTDDFENFAIRITDLNEASRAVSEAVGSPVPSERTEMTLANAKQRGRKIKDILKRNVKPRIERCQQSIAGIGPRCACNKGTGEVCLFCYFEKIMEDDRQDARDEDSSAMSEHSSMTDASS